MKRARRVRPPPPPPRVPDLIDAPELAAIILLEHALDVAADALLAEHLTLIDDFQRPRDHGPVVALAHAICLRAVLAFSGALTVIQSGACRDPGNRVRERRGAAGS